MSVNDSRLQSDMRPYNASGVSTALQQLSGISNNPTFSGTLSFLSGTALQSGNIVQAAGFSQQSGLFLSPQFSGTANFMGPITTTYTLTAANSGAFGPLGFISIQVSGGAAKIPYFSP